MKNLIQFVVYLNYIANMLNGVLITVSEAGNTKTSKAEEKTYRGRSRGTDVNSHIRRVSLLQRQFWQLGTVVPPLFVSGGTVNAVGWKCCERRR